jgi:regulator of protease activity HflC (stomatin/prohibitin superfamily)
MSNRIQPLVQAIRKSLANVGGKFRGVAATGGSKAISGARRNAALLITTGVLGTFSYAVYKHPPVQTISRGEVGIRTNQFTGTATEWRNGSVMVIPGFHDLRRFALRDQVFRPTQSASATGEAPFQSLEGLSVGVDLSVRYALDPTKVVALSKDLPEYINGEIVEPAVRGVIYKVFTRYTVREIFSTKRAEIQKTIETELKPKLASDGIVLRNVQIGKVDLPADYKQGMEKLLAEELETEKMKYTLTLKESKVKETALEADAAKVRREKAAEAAANEQIIAAKAQEEAMKHVLPFKQKQIEQRQLEAEAERQTRVKAAEGSSQARKIEAAGEAESRQKLADAEAYRLDKVGRVTVEQMAREGAVITKHPLLIQKTLADKLSDKIQVIIAPPPSNGDFIANALLGKTTTVAQNGKTDSAEKEVE